MKQTCILVLGMHRSGTSALTGTLGLLDVYLGKELMEANFANEKGYFENDKLYKINEELLSKCNSSWDDTFYDTEKLVNINSLDKLKETIKKEFKYSDIFAIKDPRLAFLFPVYKKVLEELNIEIKIILPYRNPVEVASSLNSRDGMSMEKGMLLWAYHFLLTEKFSRDHKRAFVGFDELMDDSENVIKNISSKLDLNLTIKYTNNKKEIEKFLEPDLKHHNISMDNLSKNTPSIVKKILKLEDDFNKSNSTEKLDSLREEFFSYQELFYNREIADSLSELKQAKEELSQTQQSLHAETQELTETKETLKQAEDSLAQTKYSLEAKDDELKQAKEELSQTQQSLHAETQELTETKETLKQSEQSLHLKSEELQTTKQTLNKSEQSLHLKSEELQNTKATLNKSEQSLHLKSEELQNTKATLNKSEQSLHLKSEELQNTKATLKQSEQSLHAKSKELQNTKETLNKSEHSLHVKKQELDKTIKSKEDEIEALKDELVEFYEDSNCMLSKAVKKIKGLVR